MMPVSSKILKLRGMENTVTASTHSAATLYRHKGEGVNEFRQPVPHMAIPTFQTGAVRSETPLMVRDDERYFALWQET